MPQCPVAGDATDRTERDETQSDAESTVHVHITSEDTLGTF